MQTIEIFSTSGKLIDLMDILLCQIFLRALFILYTTLAGNHSVPIVYNTEEGQVV